MNAVVLQLLPLVLFPEITAYKPSLHSGFKLVHSRKIFRVGPSQKDVSEPIQKHHPFVQV